MAQQVWFLRAELRTSPVSVYAPHAGSAVIREFGHKPDNNFRGDIVSVD
jgi:hypothetical protein